jgi:hypothetical protein
MDRSMDSLEDSPGFSYRRLVVTLLVAAAIIVVGSLVVRSFPNSGHKAGYDAVMKRGTDWVRAEVGAANGTALPLCESLHDESEASPGSPHYEYESFVKGCGEAVDTVLGSHVALVN